MKNDPLSWQSPIKHSLPGSGRLMGSRNGIDIVRTRIRKRTARSEHRFSVAPGRKWAVLLRDLAFTSLAGRLCVFDRKAIFPNICGVADSPAAQAMPAKACRFIQSEGTTTKDVLFQKRSPKGQDNRGALSRVFAGQAPDYQQRGQVHGEKQRVPWSGCISCRIPGFKRGMKCGPSGPSQGHLQLRPGLTLLLSSSAEMIE